MLPKKNKILKQSFKPLCRKGKKIDNFALIFIFSLSHIKKNKISFIIPNSVSKKATVRNKLKRKGKFVFLKHQSQFKNYYNIIVIFKKEVLKLSYKQLEKLLIDVFKIAKII
jgi:ribonuclease P protein component